MACVPMESRLAGDVCVAPPDLVKGEGPAFEATLKGIFLEEEFCLTWFDLGEGPAFEGASGQEFLAGKGTTTWTFEEEDAQVPGLTAVVVSEAQFTSFPAVTEPDSAGAET